MTMTQSPSRSGLLRRGSLLTVALALSLPLSAAQAQTAAAPAAPAAASGGPRDGGGEGERRADHRRGSGHRIGRSRPLAPGGRRRAEEKPAGRLHDRPQGRRPGSGGGQDRRRAGLPAQARLLQGQAPSRRVPEREAKKAATPEAAKALYDQTVKSMKPEEEVHARHIHVESEDEARKIAARINGGEDFAKVAAESRRIRARRPRAAISAGSPRSAWSPPSPRPPSR